MHALTRCHRFRGRNIAREGLVIDEQQEWQAYKAKYDQPVDVTYKKEAWKSIMEQQHRDHNVIHSALAKPRKTNCVISAKHGNFSSLEGI